MIAKMPFGKTGHRSTMTIFGAAALGSMRQERADEVLETLLAHGVNHIDVAASYGDAELRIGPWMQAHRDRFFLASKTGERTASGARDSIQRSLERLQVDRLDLIQLHNLTDESDWETAMGPGGAVEAAVEAREKGWLRFVGVTGHGLNAPEMHLRSLERFAFDSVLISLNYMMMQDADYASDVNRLLDYCGAHDVAVQTIKAVVRRRWREDSTEKRFSWYEPVREPNALKRVVHWVLSHPTVFLNTSSDTTILPAILGAAAEFEDGTTTEGIEKLLETDVSRLEMEPLFIRGVAETV